MIGIKDLYIAQHRLQGHVVRTPVLTSNSINRLCEAKLYFKCENQQRVGAFKFRGAFNALSALDQQQRQRGVVTYSSGNHAQAIACAAQMLSMPSKIVMPNNAPSVKLVATKAYGADVLIYDPSTQSREQIAADIAARSGMTLIPPFDHDDVIAGQGTAALELFAQQPDLDVLLVCMGGGGLLSGSAIAARHIKPECKVYGVEPEAGNDGQRSFREGKLISYQNPNTVADGARTAPCERTMEIIRKHVDDVLCISDAKLVQAMFLLMERLKIVVEPTGALAAAAAIFSSACQPAIDIKGLRVGVIISGGNLDFALIPQLRAIAGTST
jgi:threo-3-hydroxy-L-aspartate ammonia-lyase